MRPIINNEQYRNPLIVFIEKATMFICTLILWYFIIRYLSGKLITDNYDKTVDTVQFLGWAAFIIFLILSVWQEYNIYMYRSANKRKSRGEATDELVSALFHINIDDLYQLRKAKYLEVRKDNAIGYYLGQDITRAISMNINDQ